MCHLQVEFDQSKNALTAIFELVDESEFRIQSMRLVPFRNSRNVDALFSLGGGSQQEFETLITKVRELPGIFSMHHRASPFWIASRSSESDMVAEQRRARSAPQETS